LVSTGKNTLKVGKKNCSNTINLG